ncbi:succinate dehydrogenase [Desulfuribacillus stibiiarsenatis]|uniref:Succinate dehydrogenase n=1 Tax=Desulfuribacillus stibiiarsenatis TaxID=1390249 RepID=A0A1E5LA64_9FIRM|nr:succinate dehydrogenase cytochrome b558 subunit [Desulfuribacillus stibiiarsenatis]OEH87017.1 succinate dehydrogenase [Desulfuribacillus stibiiarsenatis]
MERGNHFLLRKVHSLLGVIPLGIFLMEHFYVNSLALKGPETYDAMVNGFMGLMTLPYFIFVELFVIIFPLLLHGIYGMYIVYHAQYNVDRYGYGRNWAFVLQRVSGVIMFVFLIWHVWHLRLSHVVYGTPINFESMAAIVANPFSLGFFILGIIATAYHFANGLWGFLITWGITVGPRSQQLVAKATIVLFFVLSFVGVRAILAFV